jgi:hypothetical protein
MRFYRGVFFTLGEAEPGMRIQVIRDDGTRLCTCGGDYNKTMHEYLGNTIVYAHVTAAHST